MQSQVGQALDLARSVCRSATPLGHELTAIDAQITVRELAIARQEYAVGSLKRSSEIGDRAIGRWATTHMISNR